VPKPDFCKGKQGCYRRASRFIVAGQVYVSVRALRDDAGRNL